MRHRTHNSLAAVMIALGTSPTVAAESQSTVESDDLTQPPPAASLPFRLSVQSLPHEQAAVYDALYELVKLAAEATGPASYEQELFLELQSLEVPDDTAEIEAIARVVLRQMDPDKITPENEFRTQELPERASTAYWWRAYKRDARAKPFDQLGENIIFLGVPERDAFGTRDVLICCEYTWPQLNLTEFYVDTGDSNVHLSTIDQVVDELQMRSVHESQICLRPWFHPSQTSAGREHFMKAYKTISLKPLIPELEKVSILATLHPRPAGSYGINSPGLPADAGWNAYGLIVDVKANLEEVSSEDWRRRVIEVDVGVEYSVYTAVTQTPLLEDAFHYHFELTEEAEPWDQFSVRFYTPDIPLERLTPDLHSAQDVLLGVRVRHGERAFESNALYRLSPDLRFRPVFNARALDQAPTFSLAYGKGGAPPFRHALRALRGDMLDLWVPITGLLSEDGSPPYRGVAYLILVPHREGTPYVRVGDPQVLWEKPSTPGFAGHREYGLGTDVPAPIAVDTVVAGTPDVYHTFRRVVLPRDRKLCPSGQASLVALVFSRNRDGQVTRVTEAVAQVEIR